MKQILQATTIAMLMSACGTIPASDVEGLDSGTPDVSSVDVGSQDVHDARNEVRDAVGEEPELCMPASDIIDFWRNRTDQLINSADCD